MIALVLAALLHGAPPTPAPIPEPSAQATPGPAPSPAVSPPPTPPPPTATTTPAPVPAPATPAPAPATPAPAPSATPGLYAYVLTFPPPANATTGPVITQVAVNDRTLHAGGPLLIQVFTSPNVVGVEARCFGRFIAIPQVSPGLFALSYTLPTGIPLFLFRTFDIVIAAATPDGQQTTKNFPLTLAR